MTWYDVGMCIFGTYIVTIFRNSILMNIDMATPSNSYCMVSPRRPVLLSICGVIFCVDIWKTDGKDLVVVLDEVTRQAVLLNRPVSQQGQLANIAAISGIA